MKELSLFTGMGGVIGTKIKCFVDYLKKEECQESNVEMNSCCYEVAIKLQKGDFSAIFYVTATASKNACRQEINDNAVYALVNTSYVSAGRGYSLELNNLKNPLEKKILHWDNSISQFPYEFLKKHIVDIHILDSDERR